MISTIVSRLVILVFGTLYPAYASYKAVRTKNVKEYVKWMMYWIVFALFTCAETFTDVFLSWFPFYYEIKIILVLWLLSPATKGSSILYRKFVHPMLSQREQEIDDYIAKAKEQGYHTVLNLGTKGVNYATNVIMQTAIKGGGGIVNQLKKSYSLGDLSGDSDSQSRSLGHGQSLDTVDQLQEAARGRKRRSPHRAAAAAKVELFFPEVDVRPGIALTHVRSTEDVSSGYSSAEPLYAGIPPKLEAREGLVRTASVGGSVRPRTRSTRVSVAKKTIPEDSETEESHETESEYETESKEVVIPKKIVYLPQKVQPQNSDSDNSVDFEDTVDFPEQKIPETNVSEKLIPCKKETKNVINIEVKPDLVATNEEEQRIDERNEEKEEEETKNEELEEDKEESLEDNLVEVEIKINTQNELNKQIEQFDNTIILSKEDIEDNKKEEIKVERVEFKENLIKIEINASSNEELNEINDKCEDEYIINDDIEERRSEEFFEPEEIEKNDVFLEVDNQSNKIVFEEEIIVKEDKIEESEIEEIKIEENENLDTNIEKIDVKENLDGNNVGENEEKLKQGIEENLKTSKECGLDFNVFDSLMHQNEKPKTELEKLDENKINSGLENDFNTSLTSLTQRGGKYNKPIAPIPPENIPEPTHPIKATLVLKPGIIKSIPTTSEEQKTIFMHKSPKIKRKAQRSKSQKHESPISRLMMLPKKLSFWGNKDSSLAQSSKSDSKSDSEDSREFLNAPGDRKSVSNTDLDRIKDEEKYNQQKVLLRNLSQSPKFRKKNLEDSD